MKFIVGIGNPEQHYEKTRHNAGFRALDFLVKAHSGVWRDKKKLRSQVCSLDEAVLIKPQTYVNNTGQAISEFAAKHEALPSDFLIVCDDVNLLFGKVRLRESGSAGGHHGLESVTQALGSDAFGRLRIGVGTENMPKDDLTDFVLGRFTEKEEKELRQILEKVSLVCQVWMKQGYAAAEMELSRLLSLKQQGE